MARLLVQTIVIGLMLHGVLSLPRSANGDDGDDFDDENERKEQDAKALAKILEDNGTDNHRVNWLIPAMQSIISWTKEEKPRITWSTSVARSLVPFGNYMFVNGGKATIIAAQAIVSLAVGLILTLSICTMTPYCSINYDNFGITNKKSRSQINEVAKQLVSSESLEFLTDVITKTIDEINRRERERERKRSSQKETQHEP